MVKASTPMPASRGAFLALTSHIMHHAFSFDPMLAMGVSKVDSLPHQIEAIYDHVLTKPRIRYMLAHDPGAGKTIMAGLLIKDLLMRNMIKRVLVVVPGQLREQWRWELGHRFGKDFEIVDRDTFSQKGSMDAWNGNLLITSIDFAKREDVLKSLADARFDLVVVDEAHKMSAYAYGRVTSKTQRYRLGETLSTSSRHVLFLTATPHKGDSQNFRLLLDLLEPGFFSAAGMIESSVKEGNNPVFLRRAKEDMVGFDGTPLFVPRTVYTPDVRLTDPEKSLYDAMSRYVTEQYNLATRSVKSHNITFALIILQRRFASSIYALVKSLKRRLDKLEQLEKDAEDMPVPDVTDEYIEKMDEMSEKDRWEEEKKWELISAAQNIDDLRNEIDVIADLLQQAQKVIGSEAKLFQLKETLEELDKTNADEKVLVFTESKDTLDYLVQHVQSWGYSVNTIHGSMSNQERKDAESVFRDSTRIMVATEAAGEGINLQFCRIMVNYDLPWNPNRLEQRMGRIHRYGQRLSVSIFNLVAADTREGEILVRLFEKLDDIRSAMGNDKVFDVISDIVPGKSLAQLMLDATVRSMQQTQIISKLDEIVGDAKNIRDQMHDRFTSKSIDSTKLKAMQAAVNEKRLVPEYARSIFEDVITAAGGTVQDGSDYEGRSARVDVPSCVVEGLHDNHKNNNNNLHAVFDAETHEQIPDADLVTFGHPVFDAAIDWSIKQLGSYALDGTALARDHTGRLDGHMAFYTGDVIYGTGEHVSSHVVACMVDSNTGQARRVSPLVMLDLDWIDGTGDSKVRHGTTAKNDASELTADHNMSKDAMDAAINELESYANKVADQGRIQAEMAQKYGLRSLDSLLDIIETDVMRLLEKKRRGIRTDLAIYNKREDRKKYKTARQDLERRIASAVDLKVTNVTLVGVIRVLSDDESEAARKLKAWALDVVVKFEKWHERTPQDVSGEGHGFDIRSSGERGGIRHILAVVDEEGDEWVDFTLNEWLKARTLRDSYYLYLMRKGREYPLQLSDPAHALTPTRHGMMYRVRTEQIVALSVVED